MSVPGNRKQTGSDPDAEEAPAAQRLSAGEDFEQRKEKAGRLNALRHIPGRDGFHSVKLPLHAAQQLKLRAAAVQVLGGTGRAEIHVAV